MADSEDAALLRQIWMNEPELLKDGEWIAFRAGRIENSSEDLDKIISMYSADIARGKSPIFAFVDFGIVQ